MSRKKDIQKKYANKIKWREDKNLFYIHIEREYISGKTIEIVIDKILEKEHKNDEAEQAKAQTLKSLYPHFVMWKKEMGRADQTLRDYVTNWRRFLMDAEIVNKPLMELDVSDFDDLFTGWTKGGKLTYKRFVTAKSLVNGILTYAIQKRKIIRFNYASQVNCKDYTFLPVDNSKKVYTKNTKGKLLDNLQNDEMYSLAIQFMFNVTMRIAELLALRWANIYDDEYIHVCEQKQVKNDITLDDNGEIVVGTRYFENVPWTKSRTKEGFRDIPLTIKAKEILKTVKELNPDGEYVFMKDGKQLDRTTFNNHLERSCNASGIDYHSSHKIRFNAISTLHEKGMALPDIMGFAGHSQLSTTVNYLRTVKDKKEVNDKFCKALS